MTRIFEVGLLYRSDFRRLLMTLDVDYKEDKGWLDSFFVVKTDDLLKFSEIDAKREEWVKL